MFDFLIYAGVISSLFFVAPSKVNGNEILTWYLCLLTVISSFFFKKKREVNLKPLVFLLLYVLVADLPMVSFPPVRHETLNLLIGILSVKIIAERISLSYRVLGKWLLGLCVFVLVCFVLRYFNIISLFWHERNPVFGYASLFSVPWVMGCAVVMAIPFLYAVHPAALILTLPLIYYSHSSVCFVAAMGEFLALLLVDKKYKTFAVFSVIVLLAGLYWFGRIDGITEDRFNAWVRSLKYMKYPFTGRGFGTWAHHGFTLTVGADEYYWNNAHNDFFQWFWELGWFGIAALLPWYGRLFRAKGYALVSVAGLISICFIHAVMHTGQLVFFAIFLIAMAEASLGTRRTDFFPLVGKIGAFLSAWSKPYLEPKQE